MTLSIERIEAAIVRCEAKRDAATDPESRRYYYRCCLVGWYEELARAKRSPQA